MGFSLISFQNHFFCMFFLDFFPFSQYILYFCSTKFKIMRKIIYIISGLILLGSCDLRTSDNGDLDGYWQLHRVDTLSTGCSCDMRDSLRFWSFQVHLLHMRDNKYTNIKPIFMRFNIDGMKMTLSNPIIDLRDSSDIMLKDYSQLKRYGIHEVPENLTIVELNSSTMVLENKVLRLNFRKY